MSELCLAAQAVQSFLRNTRVQEKGIHHQKNTALHPDVLRLRLSVGLSGSHSLSIHTAFLPRSHADSDTVFLFNFSLSNITCSLWHGHSICLFYCILVGVSAALSLGPVLIILRYPPGLFWLTFAFPICLPLLWHSSSLLRVSMSD